MYFVNWQRKVSVEELNGQKVVVKRNKPTKEFHEFLLIYMYSLISMLLANPSAPLRAISSGPMTVTSATRSTIDCGARAAVTTTGSSEAAFGTGCAWTTDASESEARARTRRIALRERGRRDMAKGFRVGPRIPARP